MTTTNIDPPVQPQIQRARLLAKLNRKPHITRLDGAWHTQGLQEFAHSQHARFGAAVADAKFFLELYLS